MFPLIQGILTFDTPFNGLARSMFVYGAFSNYQKVSGVFNAMTVLSAAPVAFSRAAFSRAATATASTGRRAAGPAAGWKAWQLVAVHTGTVGAIAAGGVAAYVHREKIMGGLRGVRNLNLNRQAVRDGYQQGVDTLSQGLAYINRGNVGRSFAYLADHLTFVGALLRPQQLDRRLGRLAALRGVGLHDFYASLGENGVWSGGYFVPERTFCAVPEREHPAYRLFARQVVANVKDEVEAHVSMFRPEKNEGYARMTEQAAGLVVAWFNDDTELYDDPAFAAAPAPPEPVDELMDTTEDGEEVPKAEVVAGQAEASGADVRKADADADEIEQDDGELPDESPLDITAAASLVPLPDDDDDADLVAAAAAPQPGDVPDKAARSTYMRHLMRVAQRAGADIRSYVPTGLPEMPQVMPSRPGGLASLVVPKKMPDMPSPSSLFGSQKKKQQQDPDLDSVGHEDATEGADPPDPEGGDKPGPAGHAPLRRSAEPGSAEGIRTDPRTAAEPAIVASK